MKNIKFVSFSAGAGFILSLTFGIFSKSGILKVLLTALVFALIFAVLGFGLTFVYEKFLSLDSSEIDSTKSTESKSTVSSSVGNNVDIVIEDQELERGGRNNRFNVGENRSMLNTSDVVTSNNSSSDNSSIAEDSKSNFVPVLINSNIFYTPYILNFLIVRLYINDINIVLVTKIAVNIEAIRPTLNVIANPLIGPVPNWNNTTAAIKDVKLESIIADKAFE